MPKNEFQNKCFEALQTDFPNLIFIEQSDFCILDLGQKVFVHLIPLYNSFTPKALIQLQNDFASNAKQLVHLWEDVWIRHQSTVCSRLKSLCGQDKRIHGRKTKVVQLNKQIAQLFLQENHLQGFIPVKYHLGLYYMDELVAVASFAATRPMKTKGMEYKSAELVRYCNIKNCTVVGGLSKLIKGFFKLVDTDDLMTYADRDWSLGKSYHKIGFDFDGDTVENYFFVHLENNQRYPLNHIPKNLFDSEAINQIADLELSLAKNNFVKVFNTGNLKFILPNGN